jgi:hypothetical protein
MVEVGDKGVIMDSFGDKVFVPLGDVEVGSTVAVYNLADDTRIAVPLLSFNVGDFAFSTPSFDFAGFDWKLDFNFQLIPLFLWFMGYDDHDFKIVFGGGSTYYGDYGISPSGGCQKITTNPQNGDVEYAFTDGSFEHYPDPDDVSFCIKSLSYGIEWWVMAAPNPDYGSDGSASLYLFDTLVWSGSLAPAIGHPGYVLGHGIFTG